MYFIEFKINRTAGPSDYTFTPCDINVTAPLHRYSILIYTHVRLQVVIAIVVCNMNRHRSAGQRFQFFAQMIPMTHHGMRRIGDNVKMQLTPVFCRAVWVKGQDFPADKECDRSLAESKRSLRQERHKLIDIPCSRSHGEEL
jgi:hypothetical protein